MPWIFSIFLKIHQCQPSLLGDWFYPSACIHMILHQAKADGFIDIAADKNHPERQFPHQACQTYRRNNHEPHKCNLKNHAVGCISRRTIGIILDPVFRHPHCTDLPLSTALSVFFFLLHLLLMQLLFLLLVLFQDLGCISAAASTSLMFFASGLIQNQIL